LERITMNITFEPCVKVQNEKKNLHDFIGAITEI
jgi:hypothetical protein